MNWSNLFFLYLDIAIGYGEDQNRTISGLYVMPNVVRLRSVLL